MKSSNEISLLLEKNAVKPLPATRTPKVKRKKIEEAPKKEPVAEPVVTAPVSEPQVAAQAPEELQAEPRKLDLLPKFFVSQW